MEPEKQRIAIAKACGLVPAEESGIPENRLRLLDGFSCQSPQHITDGWVATHHGNPKGVWLRGGCTQAVEDKSIADKWAADPFSDKDIVVPVKMLRDIPDYPNDLNAMHEAEKILTGKSKWKYAGILCKMIAGYKPSDSTTRISLEGVCNIAHATAAQRCEAFLRTLNLWEE